MTPENFGAIALRLAGIAGWQLGWSAEQFWAATPAEMEAVVKAMLGANGQDAACPTAQEIDRLQEMFPDG